MRSLPVAAANGLAKKYCGYVSYNKTDESLTVHIQSGYYYEDAVRMSQFVRVEFNAQALAC